MEAAASTSAAPGVRTGCSARHSKYPVSYSYRAYGLEIRSSTRLTGLELAPSQAQQADLCFETGAEPEWVHSLLSLPGKILNRKLEPPGIAEPSFSLTEYGEEQGFELAYSDGARFVADGAATRLWGACTAPLTLEDLQVYLLGPVMGFLLRRRNVLCLHSSAVEFQRRAVCLCGDAGQGKSTTAAALALRGLPVIAEDIVALQESAGRFYAVPGYPRVCLWPESVRLLLGSESALPLLTPTWEKRFLPLDQQRANFAKEKTAIGVIYVFADRVAGDQAPRIERLSAREALLELVRNTYMNWVIGRGQRASEFEALSRLVQQSSVQRIVPHARPEKMGELCDLILRDAERQFSAK